MVHSAEDLIPKRSIIEAVGFAAAVTLYSWVLRFRWPWAVWLLLIGVAVSFRLHAETIRSAGFEPRAFRMAMRDWKIWILLAAVFALVLGGRRIWTAPILYRGLLYLSWCVAQQLVYQTMVYNRLRAGFGPSWTAWVFAGVLFAVVHLPNPVLVPATLIWGAISSRLFERHRSVFALGLLQFLLSSVLLFLTPLEWHRNFRVGASYLYFK